MQVLSSRLRDEGEVHHFLTMVRDDLGATRSVRLSATRNDEEDEATFTILIAEQTQRENQWTVRPGGLQSRILGFCRPYRSCAVEGSYSRSRGCD
ncbi:MAG: hypothetical protein R3D29_08635 [Nitratireductor sp.]